MIVALFSFALVFAGILKHVTDMTFGESKEDMPRGEAVAWTVVPTIILLAVLIFLSFSIPKPLLSLLHSATMNL